MASVSTKGEVLQKSTHKNVTYLSENSYWNSIFTYCDSKTILDKSS